MSARRVFHLVTGEYPPEAGGVGDYTALLARAIVDAGGDAAVWCPGPRTAADDGVEVCALPDRFGPAARRALEEAVRARPGTMLLQYVPNALGARGANLAFCRWLRRFGRSADVRVMFHEPYFYFGWHPGRNGLALAQRLMAYHLLRSASIAFLSTDTWQRYLDPYAPAGLTFVTLPIPATIPAIADSTAIAAWRTRLAGSAAAPLVVHFGTFGDHLATQLRAAIPHLLSAHPAVRVVCAGRGSDAFAASVSYGDRVVATGALEPGDIAAVLRACDLAIQPYPDGVTTRRTTVMAGLANGVATLTTDGVLTERVWHETRAVALVPAGQPQALAARAAALLDDPIARARLGQTAARTYRAHFSLDRTLERLGAGAAVPAAS